MKITQMSFTKNEGKKIEQKCRRCRCGGMYFSQVSGDGGDDMKCVWAWAWRISSVNVDNCFGDAYQQLRHIFFHHPILFNAYNSLFFCQNDVCSVCKCLFVVMVFLTTTFSIPLFFSYSFLLAQSVVDVVLLLLLFYCRLRFCILHKWINYVCEHKHKHSFFSFWLYTMDVRCNAFASKTGCY